jgi:phage tail-like protein
MPPDPTNLQSVKPYVNFRFRVRWGSVYVLGVSGMRGIKRTTGDPRTSGETLDAGIVLERGITYDVGFERWANKAYDWTNAGDPEEAPRTDSRRDLAIERYDEAGQKVATYLVHRAWPSEFHTLSDPDAVGNALTVGRLVLLHDGWELQIADT